MYDLLIKNAHIIDGTGSPSFSGSIGIINNRITAIHSSLSEDAHTIIDAQHLAVSPGFIDTHTHDDLALLRNATMPAKAHQGVTTVVTGNCGFSLAPTTPLYANELKNYSQAVLGEDSQPWHWPSTTALFNTLHTTPLGLNIRALLGHTPLRVTAMGFAQRPATEQEIQTQEALIKEAMQAGAAGLSLGLMYVPGMYTSTAEFTRIARVVGQYGGLVTSHIRGEGEQLINSIQEMLTIAEHANVAMHISHLKITGRENWGKITQALDLINEARHRGLDITVDVYPYNAGSTTITQLLPPWALAGGIPALLTRLQDMSSRRAIIHDIEHGIPGWENSIGSNGWESVYLSALQHPDFKSLEGLNLHEAANALGMSVADAFLHLILTEQGQITIIIFSMDQQDVDHVVQSAFSLIGSDGLPIQSGRPHPRLYGTFPRFFKRYVRELKTLSLTQAVHKVTQQAAQRFNLPDRGTIAPGQIADLVIFDPNVIADTATYNNPRSYPDGIHSVILSGQPIISNGTLQNHTPGELITTTNKSATILNHNQ